jgi:N-acetylglucosaminyl-diphospho-decaprenol L-rhamnosyltransferase
VAPPASLDLVIVSYRCREMLRACLASIRSYPPSLDYTVTVVDNDSRDGTVEMVSAGFSEYRIISTGGNLGFSRANNLAIRAGSGSYVLALNPDTRLTEHALDRAIAVIEESPDVGIFGCTLELEDGTFDHAARRAFPTPLGAVGHFTGLGRRKSAPDRLAQYRAPNVGAGPVDAVNGAFMLIRRAALDEVGLFDEGYWMYAEDLDLCYRFKQAGWLTWFEPGIRVTHIKAGTSGRDRKPKLNYAFHYGMYRFYRKHYAPERSRILNAVIYAGIAAKLLVSMARSAYRRRLRAPIVRILTRNRAAVSGMTPGRE